MALQHVRVMRWGVWVSRWTLYTSGGNRFISVSLPAASQGRAGLCGRHYKCSRVLGRVTRTVISMCYTAPVSILLTTTYHVGGSSVIILITTHRSGAASSQHGNRLCGHSVAGASQAGHLVIWLQPTAGVKSPDWYNCSHAVLGRAGLGWAGLG